MAALDLRIIGGRKMLRDFFKKETFFLIYFFISIDFEEYLHGRAGKMTRIGQTELSILTEF